jgi:hypothetical protein
MKGDLRGPSMPGAPVICQGCKRFVAVLIDQGDGRFRCVDCDGKPDPRPT